MKSNTMNLTPEQLQAMIAAGIAQAAASTDHATASPQLTPKVGKANGATKVNLFGGAVTASAPKPRPHVTPIRAFSPTEKGGFSLYFEGSRFPVTLYPNQWRAVVLAADAISKAVGK